MQLSKLEGFVDSPVDFNVDMKDHHHHLSLNKEALEEQKKIKILCWVMTSPKIFQSKEPFVNPNNCLIAFPSFKCLLLFS